MYPTKGRVIFYWPSDDPEPLGAFVAGVEERDGGCVLHLILMDPNTGFRIVRDVAADSEGEAEGQWHWPPRAPERATDHTTTVQLAAIAGRFEAMLDRIEEHRLTEIALGNGIKIDEKGRVTLDEQIRKEIADGNYAQG